MADTENTANSLSTRLSHITGLIGKNQLQDAAKALNELQRAHPQDARIPLLGMAMAEQAGNILGAEKAARRALQLAPDWPTAQIQLARLLTRMQRGEEAMQLATQALAEAPSDAEIMVGAINVAALTNHDEQAMSWAEQGIERFPKHHGIRLFIANQFVASNEPEKAKVHYEFIYNHISRHEIVVRGLMTCNKLLGKDEEAKKYADLLLEMKPDDEEVKYWHDLYHGKTLDGTPSTVVASLFDQYAGRFDDHLSRNLQYRVPSLISDQLRSIYPDARFNLLDLGCGTGRVGAALGRINGHIVGVDISEQMARKAMQHDVYSRFYIVNILDALRETPAEHYEAITCADALVYIGDAGKVIPSAYRLLKPDGYFIFSCEKAGEHEDKLVLRSSHRYAHKASDIEAQCKAAGFDDVNIQHLPKLRLENGEPLPGFLVTAHKPAAA